MESYSGFASVYDELMDETPYDEWTERICADLDAFGISKPERDSEDALESERNLIVDLGCGTGTLTEMLYDKGYDMIGVDLSEEMLSIAMEKRAESGKNILYLLQDMRELDLFSTVGTVISVCDSINYLLEDCDLETVFDLVRNYLFPGGLFLFDFNTDYKYREIIGESTIAENREDCSFIWENYYDPETHINQYDLTLYVEAQDGLFERMEESHLQKGYEADFVLSLLRERGFEIVKAIDSDTGEAVGDTTQRVYVAARCIKSEEDANGGVR